MLIQVVGSCVNFLQALHNSIVRTNRVFVLKHACGSVCFALYIKEMHLSIEAKQRVGRVCDPLVCCAPFNIFQIIKDKKSVYSFYFLQCIVSLPCNSQPVYNI